MKTFIAKVPLERGKYLFIAFVYTKIRHVFSVYFRLWDGDSNHRRSSSAIPLVMSQWSFSLNATSQSKQESLYTFQFLVQCNGMA